MKKRLDYIDKAKGILIILMVIGHIWQSGYLHNVVYTFHMPAFFVISGMLLNYTEAYKKDFMNFFKARIYSLGIPFIFIEILGIATDIIRHGVTLNIKGYIFNTILLEFNDPNLWFLFTLFWIEILFVLLKKICKNNKVICGISLCLLVLSCIIPRENSFLSYLVTIGTYFIFVVIGFYGNEMFEKNNRMYFFIATGCIFLVAAVFGKRSASAFTIANGAFFISSLCGTYVVLQLGKKCIGKKIDRMLVMIGMNTIIIYGTHRIYYSIVGVLFEITDFATTSIGIGVVMLFVVIVLEIPTVYIVNRWFPFFAGKKKSVIKMRKEKYAN